MKSKIKTWLPYIIVAAIALSLWAARVTVHAYVYWNGLKSVLG